MPDKKIAGEVARYDAFIAHSSEQTYQSDTTVEPEKLQTEMRMELTVLGALAEDISNKFPTEASRDLLRKTYYNFTEFIGTRYWESARLRSAPVTMEMFMKANDPVNFKTSLSFKKNPELTKSFDKSIVDGVRPYGNTGIAQKKILPDDRQEMEEWMTESLHITRGLLLLKGNGMRDPILKDVKPEDVHVSTISNTTMDRVADALPSVIKKLSKEDKLIRAIYDEGEIDEDILYIFRETVAGYLLLISRHHLFQKILDGIESVNKVK